MKIIPVLDVLDGVAVHALRGRRKEYQPLKSVLCASSNPVNVASAFKALGFGDLYLADLDAITGGQPNFSLFKRIVDLTSVKLMVDAGVTSLERADKILESNVSKLIIGTETLLSERFVAEALDSFGSERIVVSLDLMGNRVLSRFELGTLAKPVAFLKELVKLGVSKIIILDLQKVGSNEGIDRSFIKEVLENIEVEVFVGGGVRDDTDLLELKDLGVSGVLVATALHSGKISTESLEDAGLI